MNQISYLWQTVFTTMADSFRMRLDSGRERALDNAEAALGASTRADAVIMACKYAVRMRGESAANPTGQLVELMQAAHERGSLTAAEIAEIIDTPEIPVAYESEINVGDADE